MKNVKKNKMQYICNNNNHANLIQQMHDDITSACIDTSYNNS